MRISDWSSDVCSSDLLHRRLREEPSSALIIGPAAPDEHISGVRIPFGRALRDGEGRFTGFLAATFQTQRLRGFSEAIRLGPDGIIRLIDSDGHLLVNLHHPRPPSNSRYTPPPSLEDVQGRKGS